MNAKEQIEKMLDECMFVYFSEYDIYSPDFDVEDYTDDENVFCVLVGESENIFLYSDAEMVVNVSTFEHKAKGDEHTMVLTPLYCKS